MHSETGNTKAVIASPIPEAHEFTLRYLEGYKFPTPASKKLVKTL